MNNMDWSWFRKERKTLLIGGAVGVVLALLAILITAVTRFSRPAPRPQPTIVMIYPEFVTEEPAVLEEEPQTLAAPEEEEAVPQGQQTFFVGQWVQVANTDDVGLRLRNQAGTESAVVLVALENEVFEVRGGPEDVDTSRWWFLVNPYDSSQSGWADDRYLQPVD